MSQGIEGRYGFRFLHQSFEVVCDDTSLLDRVRELFWDESDDVDATGDHVYEASVDRRMHDGRRHVLCLGERLVRVTAFLPSILEGLEQDILSRSLRCLSDGLWLNASSVVVENRATLLIGGDYDRRSQLLLELCRRGAEYASDRYAWIEGPSLRLAMMAKAVGVESSKHPLLQPSSIGQPHREPDRKTVRFRRPALVHRDRGGQGCSIDTIVMVGERAATPSVSPVRSVAQACAMILAEARPSEDLPDVDFLSRCEELARHVRVVCLCPSDRGRTAALLLTELGQPRTAESSA